MREASELLDQVVGRSAVVERRASANELGIMPVDVDVAGASESAARHVVLRVGEHARRRALNGLVSADALDLECPSVGSVEARRPILAAEACRGVYEVDHRAAAIQLGGRAPARRVARETNRPVERVRWVANGARASARAAHRRAIDHLGRWAPIDTVRVVADDDGSRRSSLRAEHRERACRHLDLAAGQSGQV